MSANDALVHQVPQSIQDRIYNMMPCENKVAENIMNWLL